LLGEFLLGFISAKGLYPICETFFHKTLLSVLTQTPKTVYKRADEPKRTAYSVNETRRAGKKRKAGTMSKANGGKRERARLVGAVAVKACGAEVRLMSRIGTRVAEGVDVIGVLDRHAREVLKELETGQREGGENAQLSTLNAQRSTGEAPKHINLTSDPGDSWAEVELWRWQYGDLPQPNDMRPLYVPAGLLGMAEAIQKGDPNNFPSPGNVSAVLAYAARVIMKHAGQPGNKNLEAKTEGGAE